MKTFGYPTSIGRWGFQDQGGCTPLPCLAGRCVSSLPSPRVQTPWNLSPSCDAPGPRSVGVHDTSPTGLSQGSSNAQSKGLTHSKHTQHTRPRRWSNRPPNSHQVSGPAALFLRLGRKCHESVMQNSAMTSRELAPNLLTHLGHGRSPVCAASCRPNPCRMGSLRNLVDLQYGLPPSSGAKCTHGRWVFVGRDCMDHAMLVRGGTSLIGSTRRCLRTPAGSRGMHCVSSNSSSGPITLKSFIRW